MIGSVRTCATGRLIDRKKSRRHNRKIAVSVFVQDQFNAIDPTTFDYERVLTSPF